ncbi:molybdate ABC transporter substrate-binding protein [Bordetella sp. BOR01]|uniref:molybdate ABC transporter substrate-binding protein n=1 Tax=Bordetella sp. BOR01 TaxID=2854779 RepID=UPI001C459D94|nr:molybdate ABC transporter substrate-binding protein [Bordetella sp. BOR01]MBV7482097.1 molybdate ABC transporter substrate-binding protein [Bordetella sp. BOR01]
MNALLKFFIAAMLAGMVGAAARAGQVQIAVATNVVAPIRVIADDFQRKTGNVVVLSVAPTSQLYAQIEQGVHYDVFVAGNDVLPARLEAARKAVPGTRYTYATRVLALWSPRQGYVDPQGDVLKDNQFNRLSITSPDLLPYGRPAMQVIDRLGLRSAVTGKLVERRNASDTRRFLSGSNTELGFVTLSHVYKNSRVERGSVWIVPTSLYDPIRQDAILLETGKENLAARSFLFYLKGPKVGQIMRAYGFHR